jgi:hypothetical protein
VSHLACHHFRGLLLQFLPIQEEVVGILEEVEITIHSMVEDEAGRTADIDMNMIVVAHLLYRVHPLRILEVQIEGGKTILRIIIILARNVEEVVAVVAADEDVVDEIVKTVNMVIVITITIKIRMKLVVVMMGAILVTVVVIITMIIITGVEVEVVEDEAEDEVIIHTYHI